MSVLIKGGTVVTSTGRYVADVYTQGDKIKSIGNGLDVVADETIDAKGKYVLPGAIDPHTHISMPFMGTSAQDDYETGTISAGAAGYGSRPASSPGDPFPPLSRQAFSPSHR